MIGFGLAYAAWAVFRKLRAKDRATPSAQTTAAARATPWALFVVFALGPCEPLIPLMVVPGMARDWLTLGAVIAVFGALTIGVMLAAVAAGYRGIELLGTSRIGGHGDLAAGLVVRGERRRGAVPRTVTRPHGPFRRSFVIGPLRWRPHARDPETRTTGRRVPAFRPIRSDTIEDCEPCWKDSTYEGSAAFAI